MAAFLRESGIGAQLRDNEVFGAWRAALSEVGGPSLCQRARAVRLRRGELLVEVSSAAHLHELRNFTGERLRGLANSKLPDPRIQSVVFQLKR